MTNQTFEREKICYEQNFEQARALNEQMNRVPILSITLTSGLWFGAALTTQTIAAEIRFALLLFAGIANFALILVAYRIRDVFESYLEKIKTFHEPSYVRGQPTKPKLGWFGSYAMITVYCILMGFAGSMSLIGAFFFYWPFTSYSWHAFAATIVALIVILFVIHKKGEAG